MSGILDASRETTEPLDRLFASGALIRTRRRRWRAGLQFVLTAIGIGAAGAIIAIGLVW